MIRLHWLRASLTVAVLLNQIVLPFAHEWREAVVEAAIHRSDFASPVSRGSVQQQPAAHVHHNSGDCDVCLLASRLIKASAAPRLVFALSISRSVLTADAPDIRREFAKNSSPRGPPAA